MGVTHGNKTMRPRTANDLGFYTVEQGKRRGEDYVGPTRPWQSRGVRFLSKQFTGSCSLMLLEL